MKVSTFPERYAEIVVEYPRKELLADEKGSYSSEYIFNAACFIGAEILEHKKFKGKQIALFAPPGIAYVSGMLAGWMCGGMVVPMCIDHPAAELSHVLADSEASVILCHPELRSKLPVGIKNILSLDLKNFKGEFIPFNWDYPESDDHALMLYTSGTTGKPKGVVHTHSSLLAQIECLIEAWEWTARDSILHFLPLHHTHGIVNKLLCSLYAGAYCDMLPKFDAKVVWNRIEKKEFSLFMAVPTIYSKLITHFEEQSVEVKVKWNNSFRKFRLMVSGSAALPVSVLEKWKSISGHFLLERYGMTETGMTLSNPLHGDRRAGYVGMTLPEMEARIVDDNGVAITSDDVAGDLHVCGKNIFKEYWKRGEETKNNFTNDEWFITGDVASLNKGYYKLEGRRSTDIIKYGGYKISALEIEHILLEHNAVAECSVVGIPDETWGERIVAILVLQPEAQLTYDTLREWCGDKLAVYKIPGAIQFVETLPRNAMGKVVKGEVKKLITR